MDLLKINGVAMPTPVTYNVTQNDIDSSNTGRSETGVMNRDRVRAGVYKIELAWKNISTTELEKITNAIKDASFSVTFFYGATKTAKMYAGDRTVNLVSLGTDTATWDMSFSLVEF